MNTYYRFMLAAAPAFWLASASTLHAQVLSRWTFEGLDTSGVNANPAPSSGTGSSAAVGMTLLTGPENSGIASLAGTDGTNNDSKNLTWKVRGSNGWNTGAPIASQGAEFFTSTVGYSGISASFDWYPSTKGEAKLLVQYTMDGANWYDTPAADITIPSSANLSVLTNTTSANTVMGSYIDTTKGNSWYNNITINLSGISGVNNDATFGFRLVNASTGADDVQASGGALDNTSGNWSFDNVQISAASAIPEPSSFSAMAGALIGLSTLALKKRRKS